MTTELKVGDMVTHGNYDKSLRVKSLSEHSVCVERIDELKRPSMRSDEEVYQIFVVAPESLKLAREVKLQAAQGTQLSLI